MEHREIGFAGVRLESHHALPERPPDTPDSPVSKDGAGAYVRGAVHDHVEERVLGGAGGSLTGPAGAPLHRERRAQPMNTRVTPVEREIDSEEIPGAQNEALGCLIDMSEDARVPSWVRVHRTCTCQIRPRIGRINRQEVAGE